MKVPKEVWFILKRFYNSGHEAYIVGGAVRDFLLGKEVSDWDITTSASSDEIKEIFKDRTHFSLKHDTVTLVIKKKNYEITPFKGGNLYSDLMFRDFTIDAIAYDPVKEKIIDPEGGRRDIEKRIIRATRNPYERFKEDPLRMLRAIRLSVELGFRIEKKTLKAIEEMSSLLQSVSQERIRDELLKILISPFPSKGIELSRKTGLLRYIIPELLEGWKMRQNRYHRYTVLKHILITVDLVEPDPILRLSALLHDIGKPRTKRKIKKRVVFYGHERESERMAEKIMRRLRFSNEEIRKVCVLVRNHMLNYRSDWKDSAIRRLIRRVGKDMIFKLISLRRADLIAHGTDKSYELKLLEELKNRVKDELNKGFALSIKDLKINGYIIMKELGIPEGPLVGKILRRLHEKVIENPDLNTQEKLIQMAKDIASKELPSA